MTDKTHRTAGPRKSKPHTAATDKPRRSPKRGLEACGRLIALGVPAGFADTFPLTPHPTGRWCKKIRGKVYFFGKLTDGWQSAEKRYKDEKDDLFAGRVPTARNKNGLRLVELCDRWMHYKRNLVRSGELKLRTWRDYHDTCERLLKVFGKNRLVEDLGPADFETLRADFGTTWGPVRIGNTITRSRMLFSYAFESGLIDKPIRYGPTFDRPSKKTLRRVRKASGSRMFERDELLRVLDAADPCLKAMVLLGINGGLSNDDVATLPLNALNLETGWLDYARPKTGVDRKIPLWPETTAAIKAWLAIRPEPKKKEDAGMVFLTRRRLAWCRAGHFVDHEDGSAKVRGISNPVAGAFRYFLDKLGINGRRNFLCMRHGFETIAGDTGDQVAVDAIMGHADQSMADHYRERIDPERLRRVVEHVRQWLYGPAK
jgi:integrase